MPNNSPISGLPADTTPASNDLLVTVDVSDTTDAPTGSSKKITPADLTKALSVVVGDSGSGGSKGLVPAPAAGDAAADKVLKASGAWGVVNVPTPGGALADPLGVIMQWQVSRVNGIRTTFGANGNAGETGTSGTGSDADGMFTSWTTTTSLNTEAGLSQAGGGDMTQTRYFPIWYVKIKTGTPTTELRSFYGLVSATTLMSSDTPAQSYVAFRFSTTASDANWKCVSDNGSGTPTVTDSGVAYAADTVYTMKIDCSDPASIKFYINEALVATVTTTLPATNTDLAWFARVRNTGSTTAKVFLANRMVLSMP